MFIIFKLPCLVVLGPVMAFGLFVGFILHGMFLDSKWLFIYPDRGFAECAGLLAAVGPMWFAGRFLSRLSFASDYGLKVQYVAFAPLILAIVFFFNPFTDFQAKTLSKMEEVVETQARHAKEWHSKLDAARKQLNSSDAGAVASYQRSLAAYNAEVESLKERHAKAQEMRRKLGRE